MVIFFFFLIVDPDRYSEYGSHMDPDAHHYRYLLNMMFYLSSSSRTRCCPSRASPYSRVCSPMTPRSGWPASRRCATNTSERTRGPSTPACSQPGQPNPSRSREIKVLWFRQIWLIDWLVMLCLTDWLIGLNIHIFLLVPWRGLLSLPGGRLECKIQTLVIVRDRVPEP